MLFYDPCFFIIKNNGEKFGIAKFQTDNTFNIKLEAFMKKKESKIIKAKFKAKTQTILETGILRDFNGYSITIKAESIMVIQKN